MHPAAAAADLSAHYFPAKHIARPLDACYELAQPSAANTRNPMHGLGARTTMEAGNDIFDDMEAAVIRVS